MRLAVLLLALAGALAAVLGFLLLRGGGEEPDFRGSEPPAGLTLPAFTVQMPGGWTVRAADFRGKALAVTFLDTECTEACPVIAAQMAQAMRSLGDDRRRVAAVAFSVDPVGDTPRRIQSFLQRYRAHGVVHYVDGTVAELRRVWRGFGVAASYETGSSNIHSAPVRVYDRDGEWRSTLHAGVDLTPANLAHDLRAALDS